MAAVAGAVAEEILAAMTANAQLARAYVNNGGDIALHRAAECVVGALELRDRPVGVAGLMWIVVTGSSAAVETLSHHRDTEAAIALLKGIKTPYEKFLFVSVAVVFAPLVEELAFRVFAFNAILRWTNVPVAAVCSGILFGLVHALGAAPSQLLTVSLPLALGGIVLAGIYAATRCYWASVLTHALFNSVTVVAYFIFGVKS